MLIRDIERGLDPWRMLREVEREFNRLHREFDQLFGQYGEVAEAAYPRVNLMSNAEKAVVQVELPGVNPDEIDITAHEDTITIRGTRKPLELKEKERYHLKERFEGDFTRTVNLPFRAELEGIKARYQKGILTIEVPRAEKDKPKKITIEAEK